MGGSLFMIHGVLPAAWAEQSPDAAENYTILNTSYPIWTVFGPLSRHNPVLSTLLLSCGNPLPDSKIVKG